MMEIVKEVKTRGGLFADGGTTGEVVATINDDGSVDGTSETAETLRSLVTEEFGESPSEDEMSTVFSMVARFFRTNKPEFETRRVVSA